MTDDYGNLNYDIAWQNDPIDKYLNYKAKQDRITDKRYTQIKQSIVSSPDNSGYDAWDEHIDWQNGMTIEDARDFLEQLRAAGLGERTIERKMRTIGSFLRMLHERDVTDSNPVLYICDEADFDAETKPKIERTVSEVGNYLKAIPDQQYRAMGVVFAKTGIRVGEMVNIDLMDLNLDNQNYQSFISKRGIDIHPEIKDLPDSLYISSEPTVGRDYRGEKRVAGNKRKRDTILSLDEETRFALLDWIAMRPRVEYPHPLWIGKRMHNRTYTEIINENLTGKYAEETGFIDDASNKGFTPHWFRHFFTTQLHPGYGDHGDSLPPTMIKYLRGDVYSTVSGNGRGSDIMNVYLHDWGDTIRPEYEKSIYQFGIYD